MAPILEKFSLCFYVVGTCLSCLLGNTPLCQGSVAKMNSENIVLNNGYKIPVMGLGTYLVNNLEDFVKTGIDIGYRLIDTAFIYQNETIIGKALKSKFTENKVKRDDLFIVSKLWNTKHHPEDVLPAIKRSLQDLQLDHLDLYLIHWPFAVKPGENEYEVFNNIEDTSVTLEDTWRAMEELVRGGFTKSIGVSNFNSEQIKRILNMATIKPVVNQVECNPYMIQEKLKTFCEKNNIQIMAHCPLYSPSRKGVHIHDLNLLKEPIIEELSVKYNKSPGQIVLKYLIQYGVIPTPKTDKIERLKENFDIHDITLEEKDFEKMRSLNKDRRCTEFPAAQNFKEYPFKLEF